MNFFKPLVSNCIAITNMKDPYNPNSRCSKKPDKNGFLCKEHYEESLKQNIHAIVVRGTPRVLWNKNGFNIIGTPKDDKTLTKVKKIKEIKVKKEISEIIKSEPKLRVNSDNPRIIESETSLEVEGDSNSEKSIETMTPEKEGILTTPSEEKNYINNRRESLLALELDKLKVIVKDLRAKGLITQKRFPNKESVVDSILSAEAKND